MINKLLMGIFNLVISLVTTLLTPIDNLIAQYLPVVNDGLSAINTLIDYVITFLGYLVDMTGLSSVALLLIINYYVFVLT